MHIRTTGADPGFSDGGFLLRARKARRKLFVTTPILIKSRNTYSYQNGQTRSVFVVFAYVSWCPRVRV